MSKTDIETIKQEMTKIAEKADQLQKTAAPFDRELSTKLGKVSESAKEAGKHIDNRREGKV